MNIYLLSVAEKGLFHRLEMGLVELAGIIKVLLEFIAIMLILYAIILTLQKFIRHCRRTNFDTVQRVLRLELGRYLILALELLLAADIVATAVSPTWDAIGRLAAISFIRTFLNYFLEREVIELERVTGMEMN
ncbi:Putative membrane protein [Gloeomargarita lithophora Alchichica-D10]|uniref:Membrane protein n=1 Tax=Gloeomargarita lithophora Alchichica-D10 TaxID=1188229 RepID=A0A1J0A9Y5_9CYAN|nr:DUF1622 domain-containing protein [Gloeomargarita lithophora]APB32756.1 Putative membrane protein [Gloeomargarita lithophora Alchichica-D10]